jgi:hypothetical protein
MTKILYSVQYQPFRRGASRPDDWGSCHAHEINDIGLLPNIGDFVNLIPLNAPEGYLSFSGRVRSRLFTQFTRFDDPKDDTPTAINVGVNIVVEETDDDWGKLIKE